MISDSELKTISPRQAPRIASAENVQTGIPIPKTMRIRIFSPDEWEDFIEEWTTSLETSYSKVRRFGGARDLGVDIAGFCTDKGFLDDWDNYQCKRYDHPLAPNDIWIEIGKIIYHSWCGEYLPPRKHYFVSSQGTGTSLEKLLNNPDKLKQNALERWEKHCQKNITSTIDVPLEGKLKDYFDAFNFTIFSSKSHIELIESHSNTRFHSIRFGGGLPQRQGPETPPDTPSSHESRYLRQLLDAYGDHLKQHIPGHEALFAYAKLKQDCLRQRERFYHAESLRNFARDTVHAGTFEALQDEIYHGVIDVTDGDHVDGYARMKATVSQAAHVATTSNPLASVTKTQDRQGICHQLANDDRLSWVTNDD